jgi:hypothetical protein
MLERSYLKHIVFILWMEMHVVAYSQCRNNCLYVACTWVLILGAWNNSRQGSLNLIRLNTRVRDICGRFQSWMIIYGLGRYLNIFQGTCYLNLCFVNKSQVLCKSWARVMSSYYISFVNYLDKLGSLLNSE